MKELTKKQEEILTYIKKFMVAHGYPPTIREIGNTLGISSPATIHVHLSKLEQKGYIKKENSKNRAIELLVKNEFAVKNEKIIEVPLLNKKTTGNPILAIECPNEFFELPSHLVSKDKDVFALLVDGSSMINVGIFDGDVVIVEKRNTARNGDIVVAVSAENKIMLKTFYKENGYFRLKPENDTMEPLVFNDITILGKAIGLYRKI